MDIFYIYVWIKYFITNIFCDHINTICKSINICSSVTNLKKIILSFGVFLQRQPYWTAIEQLPLEHPG